MAFGVALGVALGVVLGVALVAGILAPGVGVGAGEGVAAAARSDPDLAALRELPVRFEKALREGVEAGLNPAGRDGGPAGVLGGLAARLLRRGGGDRGGGAVGVIERIMRPW